MNLFEQIKQRMELADYVSRYVKLKNVGSKYLGLCPFHKEKTPSFYVIPESATFHCFGCQKHGDIVEFYSLFHCVDKKEALHELIQICGISFQKYVQKNALVEVKDYFCSKLDDKHIDFLHIRGVNDEFIKKFEIGWSGDFSDIMAFMHSNNFSLEKFGIKDYFLKMMQKRIIFPIYDKNYKLCSFGGRVLNGNQAKYINGPASDVYDKSNILYGAHLLRRRKNLYLVEGYLDVILMQQNKFDAVSALGTAFGVQHLQQAWDVSDNLIVAMDGDEAGQKSALKVAYNALEKLEVGKTISFIQFANGQDPASFLQNNKLESISALRLDEFIFVNELQGAVTPDSAALCFEKLMKLCLKISNKVLRSEYRKSWRDLWWKRKKKSLNLNKVEGVSDDVLPLLLFKYVLLYNGLLNDVAERFIRLPFNQEFKEALMSLLNNEPINDEFKAKIKGLKIMDSINSYDDALDAWNKVADHIEALNIDNSERINKFEEKFCEAEWHRFKLWIKQKELKNE